MWPSEKTPDCGCKLSLECKQTNTCNFLADAWRPWHIHMLARTQAHTHAHTSTHTQKGTHQHTRKPGWFYTQWKMKKDSDDITLNRPTVTDSNSEIRRRINLNHLTYCSGWVGGWGAQRGRRWEINEQKVTERERLGRVGHQLVASAQNKILMSDINMNSTHMNCCKCDWRQNETNTIN